MIDADYFKTHVLQQINELGSGACSLEIHLLRGELFRVKKIENTFPGYVLLEVYPPEGVTKDSRAERSKPGDTGEILYDRVAVPYHSIAFALVTVKEQLSTERIGF